MGVRGFHNVSNYSIDNWCACYRLRSCNLVPINTGTTYTWKLYSVLQFFTNGITFYFWRTGKQSFKHKSVTCLLSWRETTLCPFSWDHLVPRRSERLSRRLVEMSKHSVAISRGKETRGECFSRRLNIWTIMPSHTSSEASPTFGHANANLSHCHYSFLWKLILIRSVNTERFAFAWPNVGLASPLNYTVINVCVIC